MSKRREVRFIDVMIGDSHSQEDYSLITAHKWSDTAFLTVFSCKTLELSRRNYYTDQYLSIKSLVGPHAVSLT